MRWGVRAGLMPGFYVPLLGQTQFAATGAMQKELSSNEVALLQRKGTRAQYLRKLRMPHRGKKKRPVILSSKGLNLAKKKKKVKSFKIESFYAL